MPATLKNFEVFGSFSLSRSSISIPGKYSVYAQHPISKQWFKLGGNNAFILPSPNVVGYVEKLAIEDRTLVASGWAFDRNNLWRTFEFGTTGDSSFGLLLIKTEKERTYSSSNVMHISVSTVINRPDVVSDQGIQGSNGNVGFLSTTSPSGFEPGTYNLYVYDYQTATPHKLGGNSQITIP